jgi:hypothetical protein
MNKITCVEELCNVVGCTLANEDTAQARIESILNYLQDNGVISKYNADKLDWMFSDDCCY